MTQETITEYVLETFDNTNPKQVDDCTHRWIIESFNDHPCSPCNCGRSDCPGNDPANYCRPNHKAMIFEFADGDNVEFDESGLPLTDNPNEPLPWDEPTYYG